MEEQNPYRTPSAHLDSGVLAIPDARLFTVSGIGLATFLGSVLAGGLLMAMNFRALGQPDKARKAILYSIAGFIVVMAVVFFVPESVPSIVFTIPQLIAMVQLAKQQQGAAIGERRLRGVATRSNWVAAGISLLVMVALLLLLVALVLGLGALGVNMG